MVIEILEASNHLRLLGYYPELGPVYASVIDIRDGILRIMLPETEWYPHETPMLSCNLIGSRWRILAAAANAAA